MVTKVSFILTMNEQYPGIRVSQDIALYADKSAQTFKSFRSLNHMNVLRNSAFPKTQIGPLRPILEMQFGFE